MNWPKEIVTMAGIKSELAKVDSEKLWPYALPRVAAEPAQIASAEAELGIALDPQYREFLSYADGWPAFFHRIDLFGTVELRGNERMQHAREMLGYLEPNVLESARVQRADLLPIAATTRDLDVFVMTRSADGQPAQVIWFAAYEIERFDSFQEYFLAMQDYNRREVSALRARAAQ